MSNKIKNVLEPVDFTTDSNRFSAESSSRRRKQRTTKTLRFMRVTGGEIKSSLYIMTGCCKRAVVNVVFCHEETVVLWWKQWNAFKLQREWYVYNMVYTRHEHILLYPTTNNNNSNKSRIYVYRHTGYKIDIVFIIILLLVCFMFAF